MIIMMKYRVIKAVNGYGETIYVPQYRRFLIWRNMDQSKSYHDLISAAHYVSKNGVQKYKNVVFKI